MEIKDKIGEVVYAKLDEVNNMDTLSDEFESTLNAIVKLGELHAKMDATDKQEENKLAIATEELNIKDKQLEISKKSVRSERIRSALQVAGTIGIGVGGLLLTAWGTVYCTDFEREGMHTTTAGKKHTSKLFGR